MEISLVERFIMAPRCPADHAWAFSSVMEEKKSLGLWGRERGQIAEMAHIFRAHNTWTIQSCVCSDREKDGIVAICDRQIFSHYKHMPFFFPIIKIPFFQETSLVLCDDLEGWDGTREGRGYMYNYSWFTLLYGRNQYNTFFLSFFFFKENTN